MSFAEQELAQQMQTMHIDTQSNLSKDQPKPSADMDADMDIDLLAAELGQACQISKPASFASDQYSASTVPSRLLDYVDIRDCPDVVWRGQEFAKQAIDWMKVCRFVYRKSYSDILSEYQQVTDTTIHWRAVLDVGREMIRAAYLEYNLPDHIGITQNYDSYQGPSRSQEEFDARAKTWQVKKEVWEATIEFADTPFQESLNAVQLESRNLRDALDNREQYQFFEPWQEFAPSKELMDRIEHTRHLLNPFDPIFPGGMTIGDIMSNSDF